MVFCYLFCFPSLVFCYLFIIYSYFFCYFFSHLWYCNLQNELIGSEGRSFSSISLLFAADTV